MPDSPELLLNYVNLEGSRWYVNRFSGFLRFIDVNDAALEAEGAVAMQMPADSHTEVWELDNTNYRLDFEIQHGTACLAVQESGSKEWKTSFLDTSDPDGKVATVTEGAKYCFVTFDEEAVVLGRTPKRFRKNYERSLTGNKGHEFFYWIFIHIDADKRGAGDKTTLAEDRSFIARGF